MRGIPQGSDPPADEESDDQQGKVTLLLRLLARRLQQADGVPVERIRSERRREVLDAWLDAAIFAADEMLLWHLVERTRRAPPPME